MTSAERRVVKEVLHATRLHAIVVGDYKHGGELQDVVDGLNISASKLDILLGGKGHTDCVRSCDQGTCLTRREWADVIAMKTLDAASARRYSVPEWRNCAFVCLKHGCSSAEAEAVLRSKWTRWASDHSDKSFGDAKGSDLERYMKQEAKRNQKTIKELAKRLLRGA